MITINLRPGSKRPKSGPTMGNSLASLRQVAAKLKNPLPLAAALVWVGALGFLGYVFFTTSSQLNQLEPKLESARNENRRFKSVLTQMRKEEKIRDSLAAQIVTIRRVDGDRYVLGHILDEVSRALPPYTWLVDLTMVPAPAPAVNDSTEHAPAPVQFQITGRTTDIQGYTRFLRQLEDSPWLGEVTAVSANTIVEQNHAVTAFVLRGIFTRADSAYSRNVPVVKSIVAGAER